MKQTTRLRRAAVIGALITVPLAPLTACGGNDSGGDSGGGAENEQTEGGDEDDGGIY